LVLLWAPPALRAWQERVFDGLLMALPAPPAPDWPLVVVEIGATDAAGSPWSRAASAQLAGVLAGAGPRLVAWDMVFAGGCESAATADLAVALGRVPTVLGLLMSRAPGRPTTLATPWAVDADLAPALWSAPGVELPCPALMVPGVTLAALALPGAADARVRAVPAAVAAGGRVWPGLAPRSGAAPWAPRWAFWPATGRARRSGWAGRWHLRGRTACSGCAPRPPRPGPRAACPPKGCWPILVRPPHWRGRWCWSA
jgi:hypothetical protein